MLQPPIFLGLASKELTTRQENQLKALVAVSKAVKNDRFGNRFTT